MGAAFQFLYNLMWPWNNLPKDSRHGLRHRRGNMINIVLNFILSRYGYIAAAYTTFSVMCLQ